MAERATDKESPRHDLHATELSHPSWVVMQRGRIVGLSSEGISHPGCSCSLSLNAGNLSERR